MGSVGPIINLMPTFVSVIKEYLFCYRGWRSKNRQRFHWRQRIKIDFYWPCLLRNVGKISSPISINDSDGKKQSYITVWKSKKFSTYSIFNWYYTWFAWQKNSRISTLWLFYFYMKLSRHLDYKIDTLIAIIKSVVT